MKKTYTVFSFILVISSWLWAQNLSLSLNTNNDAQRQENWNLSIQLQEIGSLNKAFAFSFPASTNFTPITIKSANRTFWLKNDSTFPDSENVVHWEKVDSLLILRFAPNISFANSNLTIQLNLTNRDRGQSKGQIKWLNLQQNGQPGALLDQAEFNFQQGMTR